MSLINDALKRAKRAQQKAPPTPPPPPGPTRRPVEPVRRSESKLPILLPLALVVFLSVAGLIVWFTVQSGGGNKSSSRKASASAIKPVPVGDARMIVSPKSAAASLKGEEKTDFANQQNFIPNVTIRSSPPVATVSAPKPEPPALPVMSTPIPAPATIPNQPVTQPAASVATPKPLVAAVALPTVVSNEPPPPPPLPKLQGIFYRPERPAVLLNGKTVLIGGMSGEYRVVAISQQSATVERAGQTNVLNMPD
jgi:hypothetical protein